MSTRRWSVAALAAALTLAGCGGTHHSKPKRTRLPAPVREADVDVLAPLLALEQQGIAADTAAGPQLSGLAQHAAGRFLGQDLRHAGVLRVVIRQAGGRPRGPSPGYDLGHPRTPGQVLALLVDQAERELDADLGAMPLLAAPVARRELGAILADEAQQLTVLHEAQRRPRLDPRFARALAAARAVPAVEPIMALARRAGPAYVLALRAPRGGRWGRRAEARAERLLSDVEGAGYAALRHLSGGQAVLAAELMAYAAQRAAVMVEIRHPGRVSRAVPTALVRGIPPRRHHVRRRRGSGPAGSTAGASSGTG